MIGVRDNLDGQNLFQCRIPDFEPFFDGFLGEFPWGTAFDMARYYDWESSVFQQDTTIPVLPVWASVSCAREYDASEVSNSVYVPSPRLLKRELVWDGLGGFRNANDELVFQDTSTLNAGNPNSLLANEDYIKSLLHDERVVLVFTLQGEKLIVERGSNRHERAWGRQRYCQFGYRVESNEFFGDVSFLFD